MIRYFVGVPGCGKTTIACKLMKKELNKKKFKKLKLLKYDYIFSNFDNNLSNQIDVKILSDNTLPERSYLSIDECGLEFNSRQFKSLSHNILEFFKLHRHFKIDCDIWSQTWDDVDKQIRDLASEIWVVKKIGFISFARCVYKRVGIDDNTHQLQYQHYWRSVLWQLLPFMPKQFIFCLRPLYYKHFNTFEAPHRNVVTFDKFGKEIVSTMSFFNKALKS